MIIYITNNTYIQFVIYILFVIYIYFITLLTNLSVICNALSHVSWSSSRISSVNLTLNPLSNRMRIEMMNKSQKIYVNQNVIRKMFTSFLCSAFLTSTTMFMLFYFFFLPAHQSLNSISMIASQLKDIVSFFKCP